MRYPPRAKIVSTIAEWLTSLGLSEYTDRFVENGIDVSVLSELTEQDFERLGSCSAIAARCCVRSANWAAFQLPQRHPRRPQRANQLDETTLNAAS
jgi:hypothetical protein